jgi:hypothetical protein
LREYCGRICYYFKRSSFGRANVTFGDEFIARGISALRKMWDEMGLTGKSRRQSAGGRTRKTGCRGQEAGGRNCALNRAPAATVKNEEAGRRRKSGLTKAERERRIHNFKKDDSADEKVSGTARIRHMVRDFRSGASGR